MVGALRQFVSRLQPVRTLPVRGADRAFYQMARFGERHQLQWVTYSPLQLWVYHRIALGEAPAVIAAIIDVFPELERFADVGAGSGAFAAEAQRRDRRVEACEYTRSGRFYARLQGVQSQPFDLFGDPPAQLGGPIDVAYCFEVAEHCPPEAGDRLVRFLSQITPLVLFTAAPPGQGGIGHVNEQPPKYWIERFEQSGMRLRTDLTARLRDAFERRGVTAVWLLANLLVFARDIPEAPRIA